jgi:hypothetical protein
MAIDLECELNITFYSKRDFAFFLTLKTFRPETAPA